MKVSGETGEDKLNRLLDVESILAFEISCCKHVRQGKGPNDRSTARFWVGFQVTCPLSNPGEKMARNHIPSFILRDGHEEQLGPWSCFPDSKSGICLGAHSQGSLGDGWMAGPITFKSRAPIGPPADFVFPFANWKISPSFPCIFSKRTCSFKRSDVFEHIWGDGHKTKPSGFVVFLFGLQTLLLWRRNLKSDLVTGSATSRDHLDGQFVRISLHAQWESDASESFCCVPKYQCRCRWCDL